MEITAGIVISFSYTMHRIITQIFEVLNICQQRNWLWIGNEHVSSVLKKGIFHLCEGFVCVTNELKVKKSLVGYITEIQNHMLTRCYLNINTYY